jgi:hypothetical protein
VQPIPSTKAKEFLAAWMQHIPVRYEQLSGVAGITFGLYRDPEGGAALWVETQNVALQPNGQYDVLLGTTKSGGVPTEWFTSGEARWLDIHVDGQPEQPRVLLVSVPYAIKAADAETLGGLPHSAFAPASMPSSTINPASTATMVTSPGALTTLSPTGSGTPNFVPLWTTSSNLSSSMASQVGINMGIGFTAPLPPNLAAKLDVNGGGTFRGALSLPPTGTAISSGGKNSQPLNLSASVFNSAAKAPVLQNFRWQAEPVGNNTSFPFSAFRERQQSTLVQILVAARA